MNEEQLKRLHDLAVERGQMDVAKDALFKIKELRETTQERPLIGDLPRSIGLTGRYLAEGLADVADIGAKPIEAALNLIPGYEGSESTRQGVSRLLDEYGVPAPRDPAEEIVATGSRLMAGTLPFAGASRVARPVGDAAKSVISQLSTQPGLQAATAASAGLAGETAKQEGQGQGAQLIAALTAGLAPSAVSAMAQKAAGVFTRLSSQVDDILAKQDIKGIPLNVVENLRKRVNHALSVGEVDNEQLKRLVDYAKTGATPTRANISLDPVDITQQRNLAKIGANSSNKNLQALARLENENTKTLIEGLDDISRGTPLDLAKAGAAIAGDITQKNNRLLAKQSLLYKNARLSDGRSLPLNKDKFLFTVDRSLKETGKGAFLPKKIRALIDDDSVLFDVQRLDNLETIVGNEINTASRAGKGNVVQALKQVQSALRKVVPDGAPPIESLTAFKEARAFSRKMYEWQESLPAIKAIVDGAEPDRIVNDFIIGSSKAASSGNVNKLMMEVRKNKEVREVVRDQVAAWIKNEALAKNADELAIISQTGLRNALTKIGDKKLGVILGKRNLDQLKRIQRVASYETVRPSGAAVNESNTATTATGMFFSWLESIGKFLPLGREIVSAPARHIINMREGAKGMAPDIAARTLRGRLPPAVPLGLAAGTNNE